MIIKKIKKWDKDSHKREKKIAKNCSKVKVLENALKYLYMINTRFSFERDSNNEKHAFAIINWKESRRYLDNKTKTGDVLNNATWNENPS